MTPLSKIIAVFEGSNADATRALYAELKDIGPIGDIAVNLLRACKTSERAKNYRGRERGNGRSYRSMAYERKSWSMQNLCEILQGQSDISWGWGIDMILKSRDDPHHHVLYVDLPTGQVSFHGERGHGPEYPGRWDGARGTSPHRICEWAAFLLGDPTIQIKAPPPVAIIDPEEQIDPRVETLDDLFAMVDRI